MNLQTIDKSLEERATLALKQAITADNNEIYARTMARVGNELETASVQYLLPFLTGAVLDIGYTFMDTFSSPKLREKIKELIEEESIPGEKLEAKLEENDGLLSTIKGVVGEPQQKPEEIVGNVKEYRDALVIYCAETGRNPEDILDSIEGRAAVVELAYDSIDNYETLFVDKGIQGQQIIGALIVMGSMFPLSQLVTEGIEGLAQEIEVDLSEVDFEPRTAGNFVGAYANDIMKFTNAYIAEAIEHAKERVAEYRSALGQESGK